MTTRGRLPVAASTLCLATPYGPGIVDYYRGLLGNDALTSIVREWSATTIEPITIGFYVLGFATMGLLTRARARQEWFVMVLMLALVLNALEALRGIVWFSLAAIVLLPDVVSRPRPGDVLLDSARTREPASRWWPSGALAITLVAAAVSACAWQALRPAPLPNDRWPDELLTAVDRHVPADTVIAADETVADWIMFRRPGRIGSLGWDIRFELLTDEQIRALARYRTDGPTDSGRLPVDAGAVIFDTADGAGRAAALVDHGWQQVHDLDGGRYALLVPATGTDGS